MLDRLKKFFEKKKLDKINASVLQGLDELREEQRRALERNNELWESREWEACLRIYSSYDTVSYESAVHQAHELVKSFKESKKNEINQGK